MCVCSYYRWVSVENATDVLVYMNQGGCSGECFLDLGSGVEGIGFDGWSSDDVGKVVIY